MRHTKLGVIVGAGMSTVLLSAGVFAWQANATNINGVDGAGSVIQIDGCLNGGLSVVPHSPFYNTETSLWIMDGATVDHITAGAEACEGKRLVIQAIGEDGSILAEGSNSDYLIVDGNFTAPVFFTDQLGDPVAIDRETIAKWTVILTDSTGVVIETLTLSYSGGALAFGSDSTTITPTIAGGVGEKVYSFTGTLPPNVSFNTTTGVFTGPGGAQWSFPPVRAGGTGADVSNSVSALTDGSHIITGRFSGSATFGSTTLTSAGSYDVFVAKMNANGTWAWAARAGGGSDDYGMGVSALADGSSIIAGFFESSATFGSTTLSGAGSREVFVAKMNANGTWAWAARAGGGSDDYGMGVSALADGSSIITGYFMNSVTFGSTTLTSAGSWDVFVAKMNADGTFAWATKAGGSSDDYGTGVSALTDGSSIITGLFLSSATFGSTTLTSAGGYDVFVAKINANGTFAWATKAGGGQSADYGRGVSTLADGSSIITGEFMGTATFGSTTLTSAGGQDVFVAKVNADGTFAWATKAGSTGDDYGSSASVLADGSSIITGFFNGSATFGSTTLTSAGGQDVFVAKMNANGTFAWATRAGGSVTDTGSSVSVFTDGSSIITGYFEGSGQFGSTTLTSAGDKDVFVAKVNTNGAFGSAMTGYPAELTVTVTDDSGSAEAPVTISLQ